MTTLEIRLRTPLPPLLRTPSVPPSVPSAPFVPAFSLSLVAPSRRSLDRCRSFLVVSLCSRPSSDARPNQHPLLRHRRKPKQQETTKKKEPKRRAWTALPRTHLEPTERDEPFLLSLLPKCNAVVLSRLRRRQPPDTSSTFLPCSSPLRFLALAPISFYLSCALLPLSSPLPFLFHLQSISSKLLFQLHFFSLLLFVCSPIPHSHYLHFSSPPFFSFIYFRVQLFFRLHRASPLFFATGPTAILVVHFLRPRFSIVSIHFVDSCPSFSSHSFRRRRPRTIDGNASIHASPSFSFSFRTFFTTVYRLPTMSP